MPFTSDLNVQYVLARGSSPPFFVFPFSNFEGTLRMLTTRKLSVLISAALLFGASATLAGPGKRVDRGASNNGVADSFLQCSDPLHTSNCGNFATTTSPGPGGTTITQFVTNSGAQVVSPTETTPGNVVLSDVFLVPGVITAGATLELDFTAANNNYGIFACENGNGTKAIPGGGDPIAGPFLEGPCTTGDRADLDGFISETDPTSTEALFTFSGGPTSWAFFTDPGGLLDLKFTPAGSTGGGGTTTPEPGSASLLLAGALAAGLMALKVRR
jgi:hypothetical protein